MSLRKTDKQIYKLIKAEAKRQVDQLEMIPSENYASKAVLEATGSVLANKYSEGLVAKRYYQGNEIIDEIEKLAIERVKKLFKVPHANVQSYSGSPANSAVYFALLERRDKIMGLKLASGGHLTHGHPKITFSGKYFKSIQYGVEKDGFIDYDKLEKLALKHKPKIIVSGTTAYPRILDFKRFGKIAEKVGAWHLSDISHIAGLVVTGYHPSPVRHSHIVMFTTHKTMRGPRGAVLLVTDRGLKKDPDLSGKIDRAVFPGLQGGPHNNTTAALAVCFKEASLSSFKKYSKQIVKNAKVLAKELKKLDFKLISGGTDNHLILMDVTNKGVDGWVAAWALEYAGIIVNRNSIPYDTKSPFYPSGIRLGTPAITSRGMGDKEMIKIATWIGEVMKIATEVISKDIKSNDKKKQRAARAKFKKDIQKNNKIIKIRREVKKLCLHFLIPSL